MSLRIQTNVEAFRAQRNLDSTTTQLSKSMERLSSGYRINRAGDDAAGLTISEKLVSQVRGLQQAGRNAQDAISMIQTAEGALNEVHSMLQRVRELAVQYNNGTLSDADKAAITAEVTQLSSEISRIGSDTKFNQIALLTGTADLTFQIGADDGQTIGVSVDAMVGDSTSGQIDAGIFSFDTAANLASIDVAIANVAEKRSSFGAVQNRLEHTLNNLGVFEENLTSSLSRIRDVDVAGEMVNFTKRQIMQQAGVSMLAQANMLPQSALSLLG